MMAVVAATTSTITIWLPVLLSVMATVLSVPEAELAVSKGAAVCGGGMIVSSARILQAISRTHSSVKKFIESDGLMHGKFGHKNCAIK